MKLHVSGMGQATGQYRFLWGFYVRGFKPWLHCQPCFRGTRAEGINPLMEDQTVYLNKSSDFFYLCGYAGGPRASRGVLNMHLAVRAKKDSQAVVRSAFGPVFTIYGAEEIQIPDSDAPLAKRGEFDHRCKNLRFAAQMYPGVQPGHDAPHEPILVPRGLGYPDLSSKDSVHPLIA